MGDTSYIQHDLQGARELLQANGWNEETLADTGVWLSQRRDRTTGVRAVPQFHDDAGYPADKIRPLIFATYGDYQRAYSQGKVTLINSSWTMDYPDAENLMQLYYGPNAAPGSNSASYNNPEYNRLYETSCIHE